MENKHIQMKGIPQETKALIDEAMTHCEAIAEFSDNALDAGANNFSIELNENACLTMKDDGCGIKDLENMPKSLGLIV